jgi:8-oxo-dGTP pyrophosphatase MutT (NUDIX family)
VNSPRPALDPNWLHQLSQQLDRAPLTPRAVLGLAVDGRASVAVGSIETALAIRLASSGFPLRDMGNSWALQPASASDVEATLAAIANWLRADGPAAAWRGELVAIVDEAGKRVAAIERAAARALGITTHAVHLVVRDDRGHVWVQLRAFDKSTDPGLWDTTMGGLMSANEAVTETLQRETWEEAGLHITDLREVTFFGRTTVRRPVQTGYMIEHVEMFEALAPMALQPTNQDGEVERFECLSISALIERLYAGAFTLEAATVLATWLQRSVCDHPIPPER